jgi:ABC-type multidrug transport system ATPase subunit
LDSFTANKLMQTLRAIAHKQRTVICTIHQPRSDIFQLCDSILLLAKGTHHTTTTPPSSILILILMVMVAAPSQS